MLNNHPRLRLALYLVGLGALAIAPTLAAVGLPELADALRDGANVLGAAALGTAALNTPLNVGRHRAES